MNWGNLYNKLVQTPCTQPVIANRSLIFRVKENAQEIFIMVVLTAGLGLM